MSFACTKDGRHYMHKEWETCSCGLLRVVAKTDRGGRFIVFTAGRVTSVRAEDKP